MKTPDMESQGTFEEFCGSSTHYLEKAYRHDKENNFTTDFM